MAIKLTINSVDFSSYIQKTQDIEETMRKIYGKAQATGLDGTAIPNLIAVKWDVSFTTVPMPQDMAEQLIQYMEMETVTVRYTSFKVAGGGVRAIKAMPVTMTVSYATDNYSGTRIYQGFRLAFEEV